ncbi:MAG: CHAP domain-containing protein [Gammaproteobacteria bacterium]|nr:CHAP domain-containing protein [Gammaproteobacteria bacterium]
MERQHRIEQARQRLVQEANRLVGSDDYNAWTMKGGIRWFGDPKCNLFVSDVASLANAGVPLVNGGVYPPTAAQWADPSFDIPGWEVVSTPNPGDIAAIAKSSLNATGHVGIVAGDRLTVSATTTHGVVRNDWAFRQGQSPTFRRYVGD